MNKKIVRLGGVTAVLGGIYLLILAGFQVFANGDIEDQSFLWQTITLMPVLLAVGAAGLYTLANGHPGVQAGAVVTWLGAVLMAVGFALMTWLDNENGWGVMFLGMVLLPVGMLIFGLANRQAKVLPRWNGIPIIVGGIATSLLPISIVLSDQLDLLTEQQSSMLFAFYLMLLAAGWIVMGVLMFADGGETAVPVTTTLTLLLMVFLLAGCGGGSGGRTGDEAKVTFQTPKDGESVSSPVQVVMKAENFTVEEAGDIHEGAGHLHVMIDTPCLDAGEAIPKDDNHRHFGDGSTQADLELTSGTHTLCLQAADGAHVALEGAGMTHQISVTVP